MSRRHWIAPAVLFIGCTALALVSQPRAAHACHPVRLDDPMPYIGHFGCGGPKPPPGIVPTPSYIPPPFVVPPPLVVQPPPAMVETAAPVPIRVQPSPTAVRGDPPSPPVLLEPTIVSNDSNAEAAIADLAARLDVDLSMIVLAAMDEVTWADTSLGCPEPDRAYLQVLTPGLRIVLVVGDSTYEYHSGFGGRLILCTNPRPPVM